VIVVAALLASVAFVAYRFGRWVKRSDLLMANFNSRREIAELREKVARLEAEVQAYENDEGMVTWQ
jgi:uncharacterized protein YlxW (UPF0749 family)